MKIFKRVARFARGLRARWTDYRTGTLVCYGGPLDGERRSYVLVAIIAWGSPGYGGEVGYWQLRDPRTGEGDTLYQRSDARRRFEVTPAGRPPKHLNTFDFGSTEEKP